MIKRRFVLFSAATALLPALAQEQRAKFDPRREGVADVAAAVLRAASEGKRVIADVGGEWCTWCHLMDQFIAANPDVRAVLEANFVWVKVNYSPSNKNERLLSMWPKIIFA